MVKVFYTQKISFIPQKKKQKPFEIKENFN